MSNRETIYLYTDGAASGNPGPGGFGVVLKCGNLTKELSGGFALTTNNRMELLAVIEGLKNLKQPCKVNIYSDSQYVVNAMRLGWAKQWRKKNWKKSDNKPALNSDLWLQLLELTEGFECCFFWVRGHSGHPENERCDRLAVKMAEIHSKAI